MKLQFLKSDSILPTTFYHPPYMLEHLVNCNYPNYRRISENNMEDLSRSSSTNCSQISESDSEEDVYMLNSEENPEKSFSLNYLSGVDNSMKTFQEIYQPCNRIEEKKYFFDPELHFQNDETVLNLSDLLKELKLRDENFDTTLSTSIEKQLGIKDKSCFTLEGLGIENPEKAFGDEISISTEILGLGKLITECYDEEIDEVPPHYSQMQNSFSLSLSDGNEKEENSPPMESFANEQEANLETFMSDCHDEDVVEDPSPYESQILNIPYFSLSDDNEYNQILTPEESLVNNSMFDHESAISNDIITEQLLDTNGYADYSDKDPTLFDTSIEQILENHPIFPDHSEIEIAFSNLETDFDVLHDNLGDMEEDNFLDHPEVEIVSSNIETDINVLRDSLLEIINNFPDHSEIEIVSTNLETDINVLHDSLGEMVNNFQNHSEIVSLNLETGINVLHDSLDEMVNNFPNHSEIEITPPNLETDINVLQDSSGEMVNNFPNHPEVEIVSSNLETDINVLHDSLGEMVNNFPNHSEIVSSNLETGINVQHDSLGEMENNFPDLSELETVVSNLESDINFLHKSLGEIVDKPIEISIPQIPIPKTCDELSVEPLPLAKLNFTHRNHSTFTKPATFIIDNIETFESKFDIFCNDALDFSNLHIFDQSRIEKRLKVIPYENDGKSLSSSHSFTAKSESNNQNTKSNAKYWIEKADSEDKKEISEHGVLSAESALSKPETFSMINEQHMLPNEKNLKTYPKIEKDLKSNSESLTDFESDNTFTREGDFEEIFSDDDGENFFDSFDEIVFDTPLECIEKTELIFTSEHQDSKSNETKETENDVVFSSDLPVIFKCVDEDTLETREILLYPQERLQAIFDAAFEKPISREDAIKQLIKESKIYDGKTIGIIPNIKEPQYLQTEENDLPLSDAFEFILGEETSDLNSQPEPQPKTSLEDDKNCGGDVVDPSLPALSAQQESPQKLKADSSSTESIKPPSSPKVVCKDESYRCNKCGLKETVRTPSATQFTAPRSSPGGSSVCIRYQRRHGIAGRTSSAVPIVKTIKENVERHTEFGCERYKRYSTYFFSPRGKQPPWGTQSGSKNSTAQGNAKNKKVNIEEIAASDFKSHFQLYARRGRLKSGTVISKANSNYWLKKTGVVYDGRSERVAEECFAEVAEKKLVLNIFDYIKYLIAVSRKSGLALTDIVNQLKGIANPEKNTQRKASDSGIRRPYALNNPQTFCSSPRAAYSRPLNSRSSRIPVSFQNGRNYRIFK